MKGQSGDIGTESVEDQGRGAKASIADTAVLGTSFVGAAAADRQSWIDAAEKLGNDAAAATAEQYANNTTGSLGGFLGEEYFVRTYNIHAAEAGYSADAFLTRLGSHELNSPDILSPWGEVFQPKFYQTANGSAGAVSEIVEVNGELVNRYADQTLLVPVDQFADVQRIITDRVAEAVSAGDMVTADLLQDSLSRLRDRISSPDGTVHSDAFSYADLQDRAIAAQAGQSIDIGNGFDFLDSGTVFGEHALYAAGISLGVDAASLLVSATGDLFAGRITRAEFGTRANHWWAGRGRPLAVQAAGRSAVAGTLASLEFVDPTGATLLATVIWDGVRIALATHKGELDDVQVGQQLRRIVTHKAPTILATSAAASAIGAGPAIAAMVAGHLLVSEVFRSGKAKDAFIQSLGSFLTESERTASAMARHVDTQLETLALAGDAAVAINRTEALTSRAVQDTENIADTSTQMEQTFGGLMKKLSVRRRPGMVDE